MENKDRMTLIAAVFMTALMLGCVGSQSESAGTTLGAAPTTVKAVMEPTTLKPVADKTTEVVVDQQTRPVVSTAPASASAASSTTQPAAATTLAAVPTTVVIKDFAFSPSAITVPSGTTVTWVNQDSAPHKVASDPHPAHTGLPGLVSGVLSAGQSYSFTFTRKGTFGYHCHLHPSMKGTVTVV